MSAVINFAVEGACPCCLECAPTTYDCRTRGGVAALCGYSEFVASMPPKKYRKIEFSGNTLLCNYTSGGCGGTISAGYSLYNGNRTISSTTCGESTTGNDRMTYAGATTCAASGGSLSTSGATGVGWDMPAGIVDVTKTGTVWTQDGNGTCLGTSRRPTGNTRTQTLTVEDTEADAIARLLAGAGGTWGSWTATGDGTGGTCLPPSCCLARWEERTAAGDFDFVYQEAEWRVQRTGLAASTTYTIKVELWRRPFGVGSYAYFGDQYFTGSSDGAGNLDLDGEISNEEGFETYAASVELCEAAGGGA